LKVFIGFDDMLKSASIYKIVCGGERWVNTIGLLGQKSWNGSLEGQIFTLLGGTVAIGFTGIKIALNPKNNKQYYLGYAHLVKIEEIK